MVRKGIKNQATEGGSNAWVIRTAVRIALIVMAIQSHPQKRLTLSEIYQVGKMKIELNVLIAKYFVTFLVSFLAY